MAGANPERLKTLLAPVVSAAGMDLEDLSITSAGRRRVLRLAVDRDGGVSLDDIAEVSHQLSDELDSSGVMGEQPFVLEVSSPGVGRPLTELRHFRRAVGRLVTVTLRNGSSMTGHVVSVAGDAIVVDDGITHTFGLAEVTAARVEVEFGRAVEPEASELEPAEQLDGVGPEGL
jgi:ribosome maturation factor RimP